MKKGKMGLIGRAQCDSPRLKPKTFLLSFFPLRLFFDKQSSKPRIFFPGLLILFIQVILVILPAMLGAGKIPHSVLVAASFVVSIGMIGRCLSSALFFYLASVMLTSEKDGIAFLQCLSVSIAAQSVLLLGRLAASAIGITLFLMRGGEYAIPLFVNIGTLFAAAHLPPIPIISEIDIFVLCHIVVAARGVAVFSSLSTKKSLCVATANWILSASIRELYVKNPWFLGAP